MLLTTGKCVGGEEPFYASKSIVIPDLNSTEKITVYDEVLLIKFKSGLEITVDA